MSTCIPGNKMAVCLSSLIFVGFPERFHWPVSCQSNLSLDAMERSVMKNLDLFVALRHVQQPGSYCDRWFTGGGTSAY